jgi:hypothetical protein
LPRHPAVAYLRFVRPHAMNPHSPAMQAASRMPKLCHWPDDGGGFRIEQSKVCDWLVAQPEIRQLVFNLAKSAGAIQYDLETRTWRGVRFNGSTF